MATWYALPGPTHPLPVGETDTTPAARDEAKHTTGIRALLEQLNVCNAWAHNRISRSPFDTLPPAPATMKQAAEKNKGGSTAIDIGGRRGKEIVPASRPR